MVAKIAGMDAIRNKENVTGVEQMVGAVEKVGWEMDVMEHLEDLAIIDAHLRQVCILISNLSWIVNRDKLLKEFIKKSGTQKNVLKIYNNEDS